MLLLLFLRLPTHVRCRSSCGTPLLSPEPWWERSGFAGGCGPCMQEADEARSWKGAETSGVCRQPTPSHCRGTAGWDPAQLLWPGEPGPAFSPRVCADLSRAGPAGRWSAARLGSGSQLPLPVARLRGVGMLGACRRQGFASSCFARLCCV